MVKIIRRWVLLLVWLTFISACGDKEEIMTANQFVAPYYFYGIPQDASVSLFWAEQMYICNFCPTHVVQPTRFELYLVEDEEKTLMGYFQQRTFNHEIRNLINGQAYLFRLEIFSGNVRINILEAQIMVGEPPLVQEVYKHHENFFSAVFDPNQQFLAVEAYHNSYRSILVFRPEDDELSNTAPKFILLRGRSPQWDKEGRKLLFVSDINYLELPFHERPVQVGLLDIDNGEIVYFGAEDENYQSPVFNRENTGFLALFSRGVGEPRGLVEMDFESRSQKVLSESFESPPIRLSLNGSGEKLAISFSSFGSQIETIKVYELGQNGSADLHALPFSFQGAMPSFTPHDMENKLAFLGEKSGISEVWLADLSDGSTKQMTGTPLGEDFQSIKGSRLTWSAGGKNLFFHNSHRVFSLAL
ncbi:TolB-like translocation protein [Pleomorphovibrio marinus]|uniref:hypothetical protein n=1 Tax=Pleomorphovibrio marinus TaxID=2164132 RepID=UPI000E0A5970|nr:hypothetical protein [Pleomorphovibrio marinus]